MHETGLVVRALDDAFGSDGMPPPGSPVELVLRDPLRAESSTIAFLAGLLLRERGLPHPQVRVVVESRRCAACGATGMPSPTTPTCSTCGLPYRQLDGPAIVVAVSTSDRPSCV